MKTKKNNLFQITQLFKPPDLMIINFKIKSVKF